MKYFLLPLALLPATGLAEPRIAVISAFEPEWIALQDGLEDAETQLINGNRFVTGTMDGQEVVLFLSGISMVNAAMTTQLALERFEIEAIVFSGIAGGVDPDLSIGDVVVAARWGNYLNTIMARETADGFAIPPWMTSDFGPLGMMFTRTEAVQSARADAPERKFWFEADPALLEKARTLATDFDLPACNADGTCLSEAPQIVVGGNGVSGAAFVDNAELREWAFREFDAQVLDMESGAVAQVAWANEVPFIAFRSLSDLAGGGDGENEMGTFMSIAAGNSAGVVRAFLATLD
ncbi:5'-methylthioadenosine/S-adenosylhomocysteine nucleosidase [Jannaschia donghaensis]|uniref:5'-methylthioadenosine/S-adenosylhomocysteine nucleosidase n=1 Tax=Jannaschia donghaensis TaxID=420998 RepID=A0A0M6YM71_9RHOB|nr:5'-methylthioadenosine/S-adenosylhomocysteine nucleosidase [Jannaschia donghaensis]CTQ51040.1 5'-methylthioadenosine/S-adenosylhomocysteine nucleosidase [Jannaschia donghaensis]